jgi:hypothetical protein
MLPEDAPEYSYSHRIWSKFEEKINGFIAIYQQEDLYKNYLRHTSEVYIKNGYYRLELKVPPFKMKRRNPQEIMSVE